MDQATHSKIVSFLWGIADDVLRDLFKRGKYPDVMLPMCVLRRLDAVLEPTKKNVLDTKQLLDAAGITEQRAALCDASRQAFYNTSKFTLRDLRARGKRGKAEPDPLHGRYEQMVAGKRSVVEYETDSELRDTEQVPLLEPGGIDAFFQREVQPHVPDAWMDPDSTKIGYEISFTRYFYQPKPLRTLDEIRADILAVEREAEGLLDELVQGASK